MIHAAGRAGRVHVLRLLPDEDVRTTLAHWCAQLEIEAAAVVSAAGSLSIAVLRYAGQQEPSRTDGDLEVCSFSGTLSQNGVHLHLTVSDEQGRTIGGHVLNGCIVRTTLEVVVQEIEGIRFIRRTDERTGFTELFPEPIP